MWNDDQPSRQEILRDLTEHPCQTGHAFRAHPATNEPLPCEICGMDPETWADR